MEVIKKNASGIVLCVFEALAGILLFINPVGFTSGIIVVLGIVLLIMGLLGVILYFGTEPEEAAMKQTLAKGLAASAAGLFCILQSQWFITTFSVLTILYGIFILMIGFYKIQWAVDMLRMKKEKWFLAGIGAFLSIVFAIVILMNPFDSTEFLWTFVAISFIIEAILDIVAFIFSNKTSTLEAV